MGTTAADQGPSRVLIISGSVGAGHDGAARELAARLERAGAAVVVRDFLDAVPPPVAMLLRDGYAAAVGRMPAAFELLFRGLERRRGFWRVEQLVCAHAATAVGRWAADFRPDAVVATYPPASQTVGLMRADGRLAATAFTYLTDPAAHVSWLHPAVDHHLAVTSATAQQAARTYGVALEVAGPLVPARFAEPLPVDELRVLRRELSAGAGRPLALIVAGSLGLGDVRTTVEEVTAAGATAVALCGRNDRLRQRLAGPGVVALGWRTDVHRLMRAADVLVQNAGGLSFTESLVAGLPAVTYRAIPGHGRANARVLEESGLAPWARDPRDLARHLHAQAARARTEQHFPDPADLVLGRSARRPVEAAA